MSRYDFIVGIDPDVDRSGVCLLDVIDREVRVDSLTFPELLDRLTGFKAKNETFPEERKQRFCVVVEASWRQTHNWHTKRGESASIAARKGYAVGRNHEVGRKIVEICEVLGIECVEHSPLKKCWKGKDRKITQGEIEQFIPNFPKRSNQEERDAALLAWSYAGLPIRISVKQ